MSEYPLYLSIQREFFKIRNLFSICLDTTQAEPTYHGHVQTQWRTHSNVLISSVLPFPTKRFSHATSTILPINLTRKFLTNSPEHSKP